MALCTSQKRCLANLGSLLLNSLLFSEERDGKLEGFLFCVGRAMFYDDWVCTCRVQQYGNGHSALI